MTSPDMALGFYDAPAKINLALHVTGQRSDGYHLIDTVVAFARVGDTLHFEPSDELTLQITGPEADALQATDDNIVLKAARALQSLSGQPELGMTMTLEKNLPVASGMGGGSADAAAALNGLNDHWKLGLSSRQLDDVALSLGADVPMCLWDCAIRAQGIGEEIRQIGLRSKKILLVNPRVAVPTAAVFSSLENKHNPPIDFDWQMHSTTELMAGKDWEPILNSTRNDLEEPAIQIAPAIGDCVDIIRRQDRCLLARMSGSGATCFGIFDEQADAEHAAEAVCNAHPDWWVKATRLIC